MGGDGWVKHPWNLHLVWSEWSPQFMIYDRHYIKIRLGGSQFAANRGTLLNGSGYATVKRKSEQHAEQFLQILTLVLNGRVDNLWHSFVATSENISHYYSSV